MTDEKLMECLRRLVAAHAERRRQLDGTLIMRPTPGPCWRVEHAHSYTEQKVYEMLKHIGSRAYVRMRGQAVIAGRKVGPESSLEWAVNVGQLALGDLLGMHVTTVKRTLLSLEAKHSVSRLQVRHAGEREGNREPTAYHVRTDDEVLRLRREDSIIGTTRCQVDPALSLQWHNGRANSRRLLTPAEVELWELWDLKSITRLPRHTYPPQ